MKPTGCRCPGDEHKSMMCFVTQPEHPTVGELLRHLGFPPGDFDQTIRAALLELVAARRKLDDIPSISYDQLPEDLKDLVDRS